MYYDDTLENSLSDAIGKCQALDTCLILGQRIGLLSEDDFKTLMKQLHRVEHLVLNKIKKDEEEWNEYKEAVSFCYETVSFILT
ncbi:hypothetical protein [Myroides injenensis]|uniref:hypothetical protein n=1 Tax=Myroides injenensis TaxID=1183151 RepID=UPI000287CAFC|nr:hypothetical protein [Myroides injenensis]